MTEKQAANSDTTLLQEVRASASWTKDIPAKFPDLPLQVQAHLEMVGDLLGRVDAALVEHLQGSDEVLPHTVRLHYTLLSNSLRLAADRQELAEAVGQALGVLIGFRICKAISEAEYDQLQLRFNGEALARRAALDEAALTGLSNQGNL